MVLNSNGDNLELIKQASSTCFTSEEHLLRDLTICQAILEGAILHSPPSKLALKYNNLFGIKGIGTGLVVNGKKLYSISMPTHEYYPSTGMQEVDCLFAVNNSIEDSLYQHKTLLELPRYSDLYTAKSFSNVAHYVHCDGYATDPHYPQLLIAIYNQYLG